MHLLDASAWCTDCDWKTEGKNAMGNAAKHHQKTGHCTMVELYFSQVFGNPTESRLKKEAQVRERGNEEALEPEGPWNV